MTKFWTFFLDKHHFTILLSVVLLLAGVYAVIIIPKESSPEVQIPVGIVTTILPGAGAEDVERLITDKIEDKVIGLERVSKVTSSSGGGVSNVTVEFDASANIERSIQLLKDEVDKVRPELPADAEDPTVTDVNFADQPIMIASVSGDLAPEELTALGDEIQNEIERIAGVSSVSISGVRAREVQVIVSEARLRQQGLTLSDITTALRLSGIGAPAGSITVDNIAYAVRLEAGITSPDDVAGVALRGAGGAPIYIRDVAEVVNGLEDPRTFSRVSVEGNPSEPALTFSVFKSRGGNIVSIGSEIKKKIAELEETTLAGTRTVISYDAADDVNHDLTELTRVGLETTALVMLMLLLTLGWRESLAAALAIPLSFLIAFIGIAASGNTINFISLFSLILAIGILVDSGIVVVEAIHTRLVKYGDKREAAVAAIQEYAWPLIAGTMTTVAVFVPLFFLSGILGKFVASIPYTVIFVLIASIIVALGLVPLYALYIIRPTLSRIERIQEDYNEKAQEWYKKFLRGILGDRKKENRFLWGIIGLFVLVLILPMVGAVKVIFFPPENSDLAYIEVEKPQGTTLAQTDLSVREVEELLYADGRIASFVSEVGSGSFFSGTGGSGANVANITLNLDKDRKETSAVVVSELRERVKEVTSARVKIEEPAGGPPTGAAVLVTFTGDDLSALSQTTERAARILADMPGTVNVTTSTRNDSPEFVVRLDTAKAAAAGVSPAVVSATLRAALFGSEAATIRANGEEIEVRTKLDLNPNYQSPEETNHTTIDAVRSLGIPSATGYIPLSSIASIEYEQAESVIRHEDGTRVATVEAGAVPTANPLQLVSDFNKRMSEEPLAPGVEMKIGGETEDVNQSFAEMGVAFLAGIALMLAILVLEFNSFRLSLYLLSVVPLSLIGALIGLMVTGAPLSFPSMLGIIALAGVIINHAIILMDSIGRIGREHPGRTLTDVVVEAAASRFRPIILTTIVTVVGMIPLSLASALWGPLAFTIMFGLAFSTVLTLVLIPVLYHRWPGKSVRARFAKEPTETV